MWTHEAIAANAPVRSLMLMPVYLYWEYCSPSMCKERHDQPVLLWPMRYSAWLDWYFVLATDVIEEGRRPLFRSIAHVSV